MQLQTPTPTLHIIIYYTIYSSYLGYYISVFIFIYSKKQFLNSQMIYFQMNSLYFLSHLFFEIILLFLFKENKMNAYNVWIFLTAVAQFLVREPHTHTNSMDLALISTLAASKIEILCDMKCT